MGGDLGRREVTVDGVDAGDGGLDQQVEAELVDVARPPSGGLEDARDGGVGEELEVGVGALEVESDVFYAPPVPIQ